VKPMDALQLLQRCLSAEMRHPDASVTPCVTLAADQRRGDANVGVRLSFVSPTVLRTRALRFYFFSREEPRAHVHVQHATGEAKLWLDPVLEVAHNYGLTASRLAEAMRIAAEHYDEIRSAWNDHFKS
jgi:hypothetical protein